MQRIRILVWRLRFFIAASKILKGWRWAILWDLANNFEDEIMESVPPRDGKTDLKTRSEVNR